MSTLRVPIPFLMIIPSRRLNPFPAHTNTPGFLGKSVSQSDQGDKIDCLHLRRWNMSASAVMTVWTANRKACVRLSAIALPKEARLDTVTSKGVDTTLHPREYYSLLRKSQKICQYHPVKWDEIQSNIALENKSMVLSQCLKYHIIGMIDMPGSIHTDGQNPAFSS